MQTFVPLLHFNKSWLLMSEGLFHPIEKLLIYRFVRKTQFKKCFKILSIPPPFFFKCNARIRELLQNGEIYIAQNILKKSSSVSSYFLPLEKLSTRIWKNTFSLVFTEQFSKSGGRECGVKIFGQNTSKSAFSKVCQILTWWTKNRKKILG